jgi:hypothetical protein
LSARAKIDAKSPAAPTHPTPPPDTPEPPPIDDAEPLTRDEIARKVARAVRTAKSSVEITQAANIAVRVLHLDVDDKARPPDPVALLQYITQTAGKSHALIVQEIGGLTWMVRQLFEFSKAPPSEIRRTLGTLTREHREPRGQQTPPLDEEPEPIPHTGSDLLPDGQSDNENPEPQDDDALPD